MAQVVDSILTAPDGSRAEGGDAPLELHGRLRVAKDVK